MKVKLLCNLVEEHLYSLYHFIKIHWLPILLKNHNAFTQISMLILLMKHKERQRHELM